MYMFWYYDKYPYLLSSEVDFEKPPFQSIGKEYLFASSYKSYFVPKFVLPNEQGFELQNKLAKLKADFRNEEDQLIDKYKKLLNETLASQLVNHD